MSELRWTLLILGVVFIAVLSWWERRRPRQAFAPRLREANLGHGGELRPESRADGGAAGVREPWIGDTELSDAVLSDVALSDAAETGAAEAPAPGPLEALPTLVIPDEDERLALQAAWDAAPPEPTLIDPETIVAADPETIAAAESEAIPDAPAPAAPPAEILGAEGVGAVRIVESTAACGEAAVEPIVDWPPEESRRIVALRLVAATSERLPGRALRLALAAEGFLLGRFSIFHKPDRSNRAVLSAASLTHPGAFDLETMDSQRYAGLSLFAVLPGPKTPAQAFEELLATARNLNERLEGALQDERGGPLTPLRVAAIRESLKAESAQPPAAAAHET
jgi:cell division protein ZipA